MTLTEESVKEFDIAIDQQVGAIFVYFYKLPMFHSTSIVVLV